MEADQIYDLITNNPENIDEDDYDDEGDESDVDEDLFDDSLASTIRRLKKNAKNLELEKDNLRYSFNENESKSTNRDNDSKIE